MAIHKNAISIVSIAGPIIDAYEAGHEIFKRVSDAMESVETEGKIKDGASKKEWVIAYSEAIVFDVGSDWDEWKELIANFIDKMIKICNAIFRLIK